MDNWEIPRYKLDSTTDSGWKEENIAVPTMFFLLFCTCLTSSDILSSINCINYNEQPKLYSIVKGAGTFNDIGAIVLFNVVHTHVTEDFCWYITPFYIILSV
jgi:hypothetical protein